MGLLYGIAGLMLVARLDSAPPGAEVGLELNVIAAAVIGGTSLMGGRGRSWARRWEPCSWRACRTG